MNGLALADFLEGKRSYEMDDLYEEYNADEEGNAKLQKVIRKRIQFLDNPEEPYSYRKNKKTTLDHLLTWEFPKSETDKRRQVNPEKIAKMQAARKKTMKEYLENI